jgi:hypothetical protein
MKPFLAKRYAKRKLHTGNQSVQFDEEREVGRPLFYSTICVHLRLIFSKAEHSNSCMRWIAPHPYVMFYAQHMIKFDFHMICGKL